MRMTLGEELKQLRLGRGLTQDELAGQIGIGQAHVSAIEVGRREPSFEVLRAWTDMCGADIVVRRRNADPGELLAAAARALSPEDLGRAERLLRVLPRLKERTREKAVQLLEGMAEDEEGG